MFQSRVNLNQAPAVEGDFAGANPRASLLGGPDQFSAPAGGVVVGRFVWADLATGAVAQRQMPGAIIAFLHRENNAVITDFLGEATYLVHEGLPLALFDQGDFWARFDGGAQPGQRVWADTSNGKAVAADDAPELDAFTAMAGAAFTIAVADGVATVTDVIGWIDQGTVVTSDGIAGVTLGSRMSGDEGGEGTFTLDSDDLAAEAATGANDVLTVSAVAVGELAPGDALGAPAVAGTHIVAQLTGEPGKAGAYRISAAQYFASDDFENLAAETPWIVNSVAEPGELAKISTWG